MTQKKILLLGDGAVGKTSLVHRFGEGVFEERYKATIGVDIFSKSVTTDSGSAIELQLWDLSGQAHFSAVRSKFYNKADGALLVFDLTNKKEILKYFHFQDFQSQEKRAYTKKGHHKTDLNYDYTCFF